jgi:hypothetical protein
VDLLVEDPLPTAVATAPSSRSMAASWRRCSDHWVAVSTTTRSAVPKKSRVWMRMPSSHGESPILKQRLCQLRMIGGARPQRAAQDSQ